MQTQTTFNIGANKVTVNVDNQTFDIEYCKGFYCTHGYWYGIHKNGQTVSIENNVLTIKQWRVLIKKLYNLLHTKNTNDRIYINKYTKMLHFENDDFMKVIA